MLEKPVKFTNREKQQLFGIVHVPQSEQKPSEKEGVILAHTGAEGRAGYSRQYVHYARRLCDEGFYVLRFDPHGVGDSEGSTPDCSRASYWSRIQTGLYVDDFVAAIDFFKHEVDVESVTLMGLCAGAASAMLTAGRDERVDSVILLGLPVLLEDFLEDYQGEIPASNYGQSFMDYIGKTVSRESWKRFLTRKTDYGRLIRLISLWLKKVLRGSGKTGNPEVLLATCRPDLNRYILNSFVSLANRDKRVLFIYGENDTLWKEFQEEFYNRYLSQNGQYLDVYEIYIVENANHPLDQPKWQGLAMGKIANWLCGNRD